MMNVEVKDLLDLNRTIAKELFEGVQYPWEVLDDISNFILKLGPSLPEDEFYSPKENVWIAKDAEVFESAYIGAPCIIDHNAEVFEAVLSLEKTVWSETPWSLRT